jgi:uncharacterized protein
VNVSSHAVLVSSRYNFAVPVESGVLLYNSASGAVLSLSGADAGRFAAELGSPLRSLSTDTWDSDLVEQLRDGAFLVEASTDEVAAIRERFLRARADTPIVLTLTTTMDCNLGCYYCYEARSGDRLEVRETAQIVALARDLLERSAKDSLHVDWYGGEPLMNLEFLECASRALQNLCRELRAAYSASVVSNGTCWPVSVGEFLTRHKIRQVQISFDGMRTNHNKRRRYRKGYENPQNPSSFDEAVRLVDALVQHVRVDLRLNIDRGNQADVVPFVRFARVRGWFGGKHRVVFQPARLSSYTERSAFLRKSELSIEEYERVRALVREEAEKSIAVEEAEVPDKFPYPRATVCAALARDSVVVGADAKLYRCGLQVGEYSRSVGSVGRKSATLLPILGDTNVNAGLDDEWWREFDPTRLATCSRCSFLPVCWAGCPKKHLEQDRHAILEQGAYWRRNLPRLVAEGVGLRCDPAFAFSEEDQFRECDAPSQE